MKASPVSNAEIVAALVGGKFKPFADEDRLAFLDAGKDAMIWHPQSSLAVIVCTDDDDGTLVVEVYDWDGNVWQGNLKLTPV